MARPEAKIDLAELEKLCGMQCTDEEVAAFFGVSTRTIERRRQVQKFSEVMEQAKAKGAGAEGIAQRILGRCTLPTCGTRKNEPRPSAASPTSSTA